MPLVPTAEYKPDVSDYEGNSTKSVLNVIPRGDGYGPFPGFSAYTAPLPAACRGAFYALKSDGSVVTFAGTATKLYQLNNTNYAWVDVSLGAGTYSALSYNANWQFAQTGNLVFATQANALLQVFDLSSATAFGNALGSPPQAAYVSVVGRFLVLSGLLSAPYRVQWSGLNNYNATTSWDNLTLGSNLQDFPDGGLVRGVAGGDQAGIIFQDLAIRSMAFMPGSPLVFQIERLTQDKGLYAPYSIIRAGEKIFFYAGQGFHKIEPGGVPQQIGRERVDRTFLVNLDKSNLQLFMGAADPRSSRVYWAYKSVSGQSGLYDTLLGYDYVLDRFFSIAMSGEYLLGISQSGLTLENLDAISSSLDALTLSLDNYATAVQPQNAQFDPTNSLGFLGGANLQAIIDSSEQGTDGQRLTVRGFRPITDAPTVFGSLLYRDTQAAAPIIGNEVMMSTRTGRCDMMRDARYARFQMRIPAGTNWSFCVGFEPDLTTNGTQ